MPISRPNEWTQITVKGLLLRLLEDKTGRPGFWFWKLFAPIRPELDRYYWCFSNQPWMGAPDEFKDDLSATESYEGEGETDVMLWRPGSLGRYADRFAEEVIQLWAVDPATDDPPLLTERYSRILGNDRDAFACEHAQVWLLYTDSTCWEIYTRSPKLLDKLQAELDGKQWAKVYRSRSGHRKAAYAAAGLSDVYRNMYGPFS
jgi:hypothetical protein